MADLETLKVAMKGGKVADVRTLVGALLAENVAAQEILNDGLLAAMGEVGQRFKRNEVFVPEVLVAARAMKAGTELLKPHLVQAGVQAAATAVMGTVRGDLHDIGKNLVIMMLEGSGFAVVDAGVDVAPERFAELAREHRAQVVGLSALLTTTMPNMRTAVEAIRAAGVPAKVIIGGAPVTQEYCTPSARTGIRQTPHRPPNWPNGWSPRWTDRGHARVLQSPGRGFLPQAVPRSFFPGDPGARPHAAAARHYPRDRRARLPFRRRGGPWRGPEGDAGGGAGDGQPESLPVPS